MSNLVNPYRFGGGGGGGAPAVESYQFSNNDDVAIQANLTLVAPSGISANDFLVLFAMSDGPIPQFTTTPSGWTFLSEQVGNGVTLAVFYKIASGSETDVTLITAGTVDFMGWYIRISNGTSIDVSGSSTGGASFTHAVGSVTTTVDDCLALYSLVFDGGDGEPFSVGGTGWTQTDEGHNGTTSTSVCGCWGTREMPTAGATGDATVTCAVSDGASWFQLAIAPA
jgi:hypothetical protein